MLNAKWERVESVGNGWCEHDETVKDDVVVVGYVFNVRENRTMAICIYQNYGKILSNYKEFIEVPLDQLRIEQ